MVLSRKIRRRFSAMVLVVALALAGGCGLLWDPPPAKLVDIGEFLTDWPVTSDGLAIVAGEGMSTYRPTLELPGFAEHFPGARTRSSVVDAPDGSRVHGSSVSCPARNTYVAGKWLENGDRGSRWSDVLQVAKYGLGGVLLWEKHYQIGQPCVVLDVMVREDNVLTVILAERSEGPGANWVMQIDGDSSRMLGLSAVPFGVAYEARVAAGPNGELWIATVMYEMPGQVPDNWMDTAGYAIFRVDEEFRLLQVESVSVPQVARLIDFRTDAEGTLWLLGKVEQYGINNDSRRPMDSSLPGVVQSYTFWIALRPTIRENWPPAE